MKIKILGSIAFVFAAFFAVNSMVLIRNTYFLFSISCIVSAFIILAIVYQALTKPVKKLNQVLARLTEKKTTLIDPSHFSQDQAWQRVANQINNLLEDLKTENKISLQDASKKIDNLKIDNKCLQRKILELDQVKIGKMQNQSSYLTHLAHYDQKTTLPNRIFFNEILNKSISAAKRNNRLLAIIKIDFVLLCNNETFDDQQQEEKEYLINEISNRLIKSIRSEDILAKFEGNEFILLLNNIPKAKFASTVAEKILKANVAALSYNENEFTVKINMGIAIFPNDGVSLESLLQNVEIALVGAKEKGQRCYQFYNAGIDIEAKEYVKLSQDLRSALVNNQFVLYYQPKLHLKAGKMTGIEALIRWKHPEIGLIQPGVFIPLAEEIGLMMEIGAWALNEACNTNKYWQNEGYEHLIVSVNLSIKQFIHPDIVHVISNALEKSGLNPKYLEIEFNESIIMENPQMASYKLESIKTTGVQIAIDHFGVGNTSISNLKQFPISVLKIDSSFIKGIPFTPNDTAITAAFVSLAHHLGLEVVAEGVETAEQVQYLASVNCDMVQGYFLSHPVPAQKVILQFTKLQEEILV